MHFYIMSMPPCLAVLKCPQLGGESWLQTVTTGEDTKGVSMDCVSDCYEPTLANHERVQNCAFILWLLLSCQTVGEGAANLN